MHATTQRPTLPMTATEATTAPSNHWATVMARMLLSSFFIAGAVSDIVYDGVTPFLYIPQADVTLVLNCIVYGMAFLVLAGRYVHIAAVFLALITMWFGYNAYAAGIDTLADMWRNFAISGALMTMATQSHVHERAAARQRRRAKVAPRRIATARDSISTRETQDPREADMARMAARPVTRTPTFSTRRHGLN